MEAEAKGSPDCHAGPARALLAWARVRSLAERAWGVVAGSQSQLLLPAACAGLALGGKDSPCLRDLMQGGGAAAWRDVTLGGAGACPSCLV